MTDSVGLSKVATIANAVYNSITANNTAVTGMTINGTAVLPTLTYGYRRNRIINGSMVIDQRNAGASGTAIGGYTIDRWLYLTPQASKGTWGQNLNSVTTAVSFPNYLGFQSSSAYSVAAGDYFMFTQYIEGYNFADFGFGAASAQTITLSFSVYSSLTGTFGGSFRNAAGNRSYPFSYSIPTANTWTSVSITIPGDTGGTWVGSTNAAAIILHLSFGVGSTFSGTTGSWSGGNYLSATGAVSVVGTNGATFYVTGVQLEAGSVATPFERLPYSETLALCQRYFYSSYLTGQKPGQASATTSFQTHGFNLNTFAAIAIGNYPTTMRANPTLTAYSPNSGASGNYYKNDIGVDAAGFGVGTNVSFTIQAAGNSPTSGAQVNVTANAEL
jgi:hypothetical protein